MRILGNDYSARSRLTRLGQDVHMMAEEIAAHVPRMWKRSASERDFWHWFCGELESVTRNAADMQQRAELRERLLRALAKEGLPAPPGPWRSDQE